MRGGKLRARLRVWLPDPVKASLRKVLRRSRPDVEALTRTWDVLGQDDPLWAVLQFPDKKGGRWDPDEFFKHGEHEIDRILAEISDRGWSLNHGTALDFGCGAGRLAQALCRHFERVDGVDIAPSMIEAAERFNRYPDRCRYHLNQALDLSLFRDSSFDFIYSILVLQHMDPSFARGYVGEFVRILAPGGLALFEITTGRSAPANDVLPKEGFAAEQILKGATPTQVRAGELVSVELRAVNTSPAVWPAHGDRAVAVGARWREGRRYLDAVGGGNLTRDIGPGQAEDVTVQIHAPTRPGNFTLEIGMLQEDVAWFVDKGGPITRADVTVMSEPQATSAVHTEESAQPRVEMHLTPAAEVTRWVQEAGGKVVDVVAADQPEAGFTGALFFVSGRV
jgi:SAM-dependent methyltransferase